MEDIKHGISKPLQEMIISDSEEDYSVNDSGIASAGHDEHLPGSASLENFNDDEDEDDDDDDDDDDDQMSI